MNVYYSGFFRGHEKYERPLEQIKAEQSFCWEELEGYIPAFYTGKQGIILDFFIRIDKEKMNQYLDNWNLEKRLSDLSEEEYEKMQRENPCSLDFQLGLRVNGRELKFRQMTGTTWHCLEREDAYQDEDAAELMDAYGCDKTACWKFVRGQFEWQEGRITDIRELVLTFEAMKAPVTAAYFVTGEGLLEKEISVVHPVTGQVYQIIIEDESEEKLDESVFLNMPSGKRENLRYPACYKVLTYHVIPEETDLMIMDCGKSDPPVRRETGEMKNRSVSVIGGASGPSAVFIAGKSPEITKKTAMSSLHFTQMPETKWRVVFQLRKRENLSISFSI